MSRKLMAAITSAWTAACPTVFHGRCAPEMKAIRALPDAGPINDPRRGTPGAIASRFGGSGGKTTKTQEKSRLLQLMCLPLVLTACQKLPPAEPAVSTNASEGQAFAQASCGGCHAVDRYGTSSYSSAPAFSVIANQEGVTAETLTYWLRGAHNYPKEMDFYLSERDVDKLVAYMLMLKDPNYRRPPD